MSTENYNPDLSNLASRDEANQQGNDNKANKPKSHSFLQGIVDFFANGRTRIGAGILMLLAGLYLLIVFLSFLSSGDVDQSAVLNNTIEQATETTKIAIEDPDAGRSAVENVGMVGGAYLSHELIENGYGVGAFVIVIWCLVLGYRMVRGSEVHFFSYTLVSIASVFMLSLVLGAVTYYYSPCFFNLGGGVGKNLNLELLSFTGMPGMIIASVAVFILWVLLCYNTIKSMYSRVNNGMRGAFGRFRKEEEVINDDNSKSLSEFRGGVNNEPNSDDTDSYAQVDKRAQEVNEALQNGDDIYDDNDDYEIPANNYDDYKPKSEPEPVPVASADMAADDFDEYDINIDNDEVVPVAPQPVAHVVTPQPAQPAQSVVTPSDGGIQGEVFIEAPIEKAETVETVAYDPTAELSKFRFPGIELLRDIKTQVQNVDTEERESNKRRITETLLNFGIEIKKIDVHVGPTITLFEIVPKDGTRISKIRNLEDDIALSLSALGIRIIAPMPGRGTIGIEVPNKAPQTVSMRSVISSRAFQESKAELPMALGCTVSNDVFVADLAKMPHLLVAGATGQGKSVGLNAIITSLLYKKHPAELKFVLVDPKCVEFSLYSLLEHHYLAKLPDEEKCIITDSAKVEATLNSLVVEMEDRYRLLEMARERNIKDYNKKFINRQLNPENGHHYMPYIVVVIDEFSDLIMVSGKNIEGPIVRIAQKARAVGIHMIIATQRPSTNVITGIIKANFPGRIAFRVSAMVDSRTIIDRSGAQQLVGRGDMLFSADGEITRIQCAFVDTPEVEAICECIGDQVGYASAYPLPDYVPENNDGGHGGGSGNGGGNDRDPLFEEAALFLISCDQASTSSLQRRYSIGYNRAGRLMDQLEAAGVVGPSQGGKPRRVLMDSIQLTQYLER